MSQFARRTLVLSLSALVLAPAAFGQAPASGKVRPIKKIFPYLDAYLRIPSAERDRFAIVYRLLEDGRPPRDLKAWVIHGGQRTELAFAPDGRVTRLPTLAMLVAKGSTVAFNKPESTKFSLDVELEATARPAAQMNARDITAAIDQANRGIKRAAGVIGFAVPRMAAASFRDAGSGEVVMSGGRRAALPIQGGHPLFAPEAWPQAETLALARAPSRVALGPAPKAKKN